MLPGDSLFFEWGVKTVADRFWFLRFAGVSYGRFMPMRYKFNLPTYVQQPLAINRKGCKGEINLWAPRFLYIGQAFRYSPENAFYIFNQQIYFII